MTIPATAPALPDSANNGVPALIVLGRDEAGKAHASWFGEADAALATKAAGLMGMTALGLATDELRALASYLPQGRVFASGRAFVPFVKATLFEQLAAHMPTTPQPLLRVIEGETTEPAPADEATEPTPAHQQSPFPADWSHITVGSIVLANEARDEGWFEARVLEIRPDDMFVLKWRDWTDWPKFVRRREHLALLHPSYPVR